MKHIVRITCLAVALLATAGICSQNTSPAVAANNRDNPDLQWFSNAKFGLFIHWGLYSQTAGLWQGHPTKGGEHFMLYERIPVKEYATIADEFNPTGFNAGQWVETAKKSGMQYVVFTTKHHDGFAMYDSKCSDYNIVVRTPFKRDPLAELAKACKKAGIKLGLYYSLGRDWQDPDVPTNWPVKAGRSNTWDYPDEDAKVLSRYIERKVKPQLKELLTNYGDIAMIWFDTPELVTKQQSAELIDLIRSLQPNCLVNSRVGNGLGDYNIIEQTLSSSIRKKPWEACMTMGQNWGYNQFDTVYKPVEMIIRHLADIVSKGGNLLLNVGPTGQGVFPKASFAIFAGLHEWLRVNGEAVYGTHPWRVYGEGEDSAGERIPDKVSDAMKDAVYDGTPREKAFDIRYTARGNAIYLIARSLCQNSFTAKTILPSDNVKAITLLGQNTKVRWKFTTEGLQVNLSELPAKSVPVYVFKVETKQ